MLHFSSPSHSLFKLLEHATANVADVHFGFEPLLYAHKYSSMHAQVCLSEKCDLGVFQCRWLRAESKRQSEGNTASMS